MKTSGGVLILFLYYFVNVNICFNCGLTCNTEQKKLPDVMNLRD